MTLVACLSAPFSFHPSDTEAQCRIIEWPEDLLVIVAGGSGKHSSWQPTFGASTHPVTVPIARRDATPVRSVEELRQ